MTVPPRPRIVAAAAALLLAALTAPIASADPLTPAPHHVSDQRAFVLERQSGTLIVGDGAYGQPLPHGSDIAGAGYRTGGGRAGGVGHTSFLNSRTGCLLLGC
jgi:hypothetical protein